MSAHGTPEQMPGDSIIDALRNMALFEGLSKEELESLEDLTTLLDFPAGETLATQGEFGQEAMIVIAGSAEVIRDGSRIAELGPGDVVGEMSLINRLPRNATVVTTAPGRAAVLSREAFTSLMVSNSEVTRKILRTVAARLARLVGDV